MMTNLKLILGTVMFIGSIYGSAYIEAFYKDTWFGAPTFVTLIIVFFASMSSLVYLLLKD